MDNLGEMRTAAQSDLTVGDESSFYDPDTVDLALNRAYRKIGAMFKWEETKDALKTSALEDHEYYDYPQNWRPMSIYKLTVDGTDFGEPLTFKDYHYEKENSMPSGFERMWTNFGKRYLFYPIPTADGDKNIQIFGYKFVDKMTVDGDITIFSYSMPEINEAIVSEAVAILEKKGDVEEVNKNGQVILLSPIARTTVLSTWAKISQENQRQQRTTAQFDVPDFFGSGIGSQDDPRKIIGNF